MKKRTETVTETREVWVVRRARATTAGGRPPVPCPVCGGRAKMLAPEEAAAAAGLSQRELFRRVEAGRAHYSETSEGKPLVCLASLTAEAPSVK